MERRMSLEVEAFDCLDDELRQSWCALVAARRGNPTLLPHWIDVIADSLGRERPPISVLYQTDDAGHVIGIFPCFRSVTRMLGVRMTVLAPASNLMSYHAEIVSLGSTENFLERLLYCSGHWDVFQMVNVPTGSDTYRAIRAVAETQRLNLVWVPGEKSPYLKIVGTWNDFTAGRDKKSRYKYRRRREWLQRNSGNQLVWYEGKCDTDRLFEDILQIERYSWKRLERVDIESSARETAYHQALLPMLAERDWLMANVLYVDGQPVAYNLCCACGSWVGQLKTSFDEKYTSASPGSIVVDTALEHAFQQGRGEFDFLGDAAAHKSVWTASTRDHASPFLFGPRWKPRMVGALKSIVSGMSARSPALGTGARGRCESTRGQAVVLDRSKTPMRTERQRVSHRDE